MIAEDQWDVVVGAIIDVLIEGDQVAIAEGFFELLKSETQKVKYLIACKKLRSAYLLAVNLGKRDLIVQIRDIAKQLEMNNEWKLCEKWLSLHSDSKIES